MTLKEFREATESISEDTIICFNNTNIFNEEEKGDNVDSNILELDFMRFDIDIPYIAVDGEQEVADIILFDQYMIRIDRSEEVTEVNKIEDVVFNASVSTHTVRILGVKVYSFTQKVSIPNTHEEKIKLGFSSSGKRYS